MKKIVNNRRGTILIFVLVINTIIILAFTVLLSSAIMDWKMKKLNSKIKKDFYFAEAGLDEAYVMTLEYLTTALESFHGNEKEDYCNDECFSNEFKNKIKGTTYGFNNNISLKEILTDTSNYLINNENLIINVELKENENCFLLEICSCYYTGKILNKMTLSCTIMVPTNVTELGHITPESLIINKYWFIER